MADISKGIKTGMETGWEHRDREGEYESEVEVIRWFKFTLKPPYSITCDKLTLA